MFWLYVWILPAPPPPPFFPIFINRIQESQIQNIFDQLSNNEVFHLTLMQCLLHLSVVFNSQSMRS